VASTRDSATGLPIYSLYGRITAPTDSMLAGIDVMLVDLPDVGARYYTYPATTFNVMRAAGRRGIPVVVLDRPNPIGAAVQGNVLDSAHRSNVGALAEPMRHGLTLGELARLGRLDLASPPISASSRWPGGGGIRPSRPPGFRSCSPARTSRTWRASSTIRHLSLRGDRALGGPRHRRPVPPGGRAVARSAQGAGRARPVEAARRPLRGGGLHAGAPGDGKYAGVRSGEFA